MLDRISLVLEVWRSSLSLITGNMCSSVKMPTVALSYFCNLYIQKCHQAISPVWSACCFSVENVEFQSIAWNWWWVFMWFFFFCGCCLLYLIWKVITFLGTVNFFLSQNSNIKNGFTDISVSIPELVLITLRMGATIWIFHNLDMKQYLVPKTWWDWNFFDRYLYSRRFVDRKETLSPFYYLSDMVS